MSHLSRTNVISNELHKTFLRSPHNNRMEIILSEKAISVLNHADRIAHLEKQIKSARRKRKIGIAVVIFSGVMPFVGLLLVLHKLATLVFLIMLFLFPLLFMSGLDLIYGEYGSRVKRLEEELKQLRETHC